MPSDPHSFDEIKLPFIFVPQGAPEPADWLSMRTDWIKLPATLQPNDHSDGPAANRPVAFPGPRQPGPAGGQAASSDPRTPEPSAETAMSTEINATPDMVSKSEDPIAAYRRASNAVAASGGQGHRNAAGQDLPFATVSAIRPDPSTAAVGRAAGTARMHEDDARRHADRLAGNAVVVAARDAPWAEL